ncbi:MAG: NAD(P)H-binding protein [Pseudomonadota bacterium]
MKLAIIGAAGRSGSHLLRQAVADGHEVRAFARSGEAVRRAAPDVNRRSYEVHAVDLRQVHDLRNRLSGCEAVINAAGNAARIEGYADFVGGIAHEVATALPEGGRFWLYGGAAALDIPHTTRMTTELPFIPRAFDAHGRVYRIVRYLPLDWSMLCVGPMTDHEQTRPRRDLILSTTTWPVVQRRWTRFAPSMMLAATFRQSLPRMTVGYADAARVVLDHLEPSGPLARSRVGLALPNRKRGVKPDAFRVRRA